MLRALMMAAPPSRIRLFQNRWLEKLTVISAPAFIALWAVGLPGIAAVAWGTASAGQALLLFLAGGLVWTLTEYALHRFVFHWQPASARLAQAVFVMHGNHHAVPNDPLRNLMPPIVSLPVGGLIWAVMLALAGPAGSWMLLGFMAGYVAYDLVHYACHQWPMKGRLARALKTHHMRHHHLGEAGNYAITGMMWDRLLRTRIMSARSQAARQPAA
jgi:sterol desaturase/sphingolipid hydroxylase (fatty acid hydroxylase superfamily)